MSVRVTNQHTSCYIGELYKNKLSLTNETIMEREGCACKNIRIVEDTFGHVLSESDETHDDATLSDKVKSYKMSNDCGTEVVVITLGATIVSIKTRDKYGEPTDVVLGFDNLENYLDPELNEAMGCIVGRCSGRPGATSTSGMANFDQTNGCSFGRRVWEAYVEDDCRVVMSYLSPEGEDGQPGALLVSVKFELTRYNSLEIAMRAVSSKPTIVNLSHGPILNLAGHDSGPDELRAHEISLNCDRWIDEFETRCSSVKVDAVVRRVGGTAMDLRTPLSLGHAMDRLSRDTAGKRIDRYFAVNQGSGGGGVLRPKTSFVSRVQHPKSGRYLEVYSDQPGVEVYFGSQLPPRRRTGPGASSVDSHSRSSSFLAKNGCQIKPSSSSNSGVAAGCSPTTNTSDCGCSSCDCQSEPSEFLLGKRGAKYQRFGGFSLLPQNRTTPIKTTLFPSATLRPGQVYYHDLVYQFGVQLDDCDCLSR